VIFGKSTFSLFGESWVSTKFKFQARPKAPIHSGFDDGLIAQACNHPNLLVLPLAAYIKKYENLL
jgi:hypothetical protein